MRRYFTAMYVAFIPSFANMDGSPSNTPGSTWEISVLKTLQILKGSLRPMYFLRTSSTTPCFLQDLTENYVSHCAGRVPKQRVKKTAVIRTMKDFSLALGSYVS